MNWTRVSCERQTQKREVENEANKRSGIEYKSVSLATGKNWGKGERGKIR